MSNFMRLVFIIALCFVSLFVNGQTFTDIQAGLTGVAGSAATWMDTDRDGDPDILVAGEFFKGSVSGVSTRHYTNQRNDRFTLSGKGLPDFHRGDFAIADIDLDGINDIALIGESLNGKRIAFVYKGMSDGSFRKTNVELMPVRDGGIDMADMDGDGDMDILLCGESDNGPVCKVYRNDRNFSFVAVETPVNGLRRGDCKWSDFNLDGLPDIFISGIYISGKLITQLYQNTGKSFKLHHSRFTGLKNSHISFGDADNDGDDDLLLTGETANGTACTHFFVNNRSGFAQQNISVVGVTDGFSDWGDMDLDGDLDILISGMSANGLVSRIYSNERNFNFRDIKANIIPLYNSSGQWGDFDLDGDLDVLIAGLSLQNDPVARVYNNGVIGKKKAKQKVESIDLVLSSVDPTRQEPVYYYVYSSSYSDLYRTGTKGYYFFVSPVKKFPKDYVLEEKFQRMLIESFPTWPKADQGNIVQNGFVTKAQAEKSRAGMIHSYQTKGFKLVEINW